MSDRANTITVILSKEYRVDGLDHLLNAIRQLKGVLTADANVADHAEYMAEERARHELGQKILAVIYPPKG